MVAGPCQGHAGVGGATCTATLSVKMFLKELARPGAWANSEERALFIKYILDGVEAVSKNHKKWANDYQYDKSSNEWIHQSHPTTESDIVQEWYNSSLV